MCISCHVSSLTNVNRFSPASGKLLVQVICSLTSRTCSVSEEWRTQTKRQNRCMQKHPHTYARSHRIVVLYVLVYATELSFPSEYLCFISVLVWLSCALRRCNRRDDGNGSALVEFWATTKFIAVRLWGSVLHFSVLLF